MIDLNQPGEQSVATADDMRELGEQIGLQLHAGTVVVLTGPLGAGKTTLTQGIAVGLGVKGRVQSPTFTIVRTHKPGGSGGPGMLHMDAYRLLGQDVAEGTEPGLHIDRNTVLDALESLDIDTTIDQHVVIAEWGRGVVELLSETVLDVEIRRDGYESDDNHSEARVVQWRWLR